MNRLILAVRVFCVLVSAGCNSKKSIGGERDDPAQCRTPDGRTFVEEI